MPSSIVQGHLRGAGAQRRRKSYRHFEGLIFFDNLATHFRGRFVNGPPDAPYLRASEFRGALAGNGGHMAVLEEKKKTGTASKARGAKKVVRKDNPEKSKTVNEQAERLDETAMAKLLESEDVDAEELLRKALSREVAGRSKQIAEQLAERAAKGDSNATKMIMSVFSGKQLKGKTKKKRIGVSPVDRLVTEPEWQAEKNGEQGLGTRN